MGHPFMTHVRAINIVSSRPALDRFVLWHSAPDCSHVTEDTSNSRRDQSCTRSVLGAAWKARKPPVYASCGECHSFDYSVIVHCSTVDLRLCPHPTEDFSLISCLTHIA